jgi:hypothetical protein
VTGTMTGSRPLKRTYAVAGKSIEEHSIPVVRY